MNYLTKIEKHDHLKKSSKENRIKILESQGAQISKFKQTLKAKLGISCQNEYKEDTRFSETKNIKFQHLYSYKKPEEKSNGVGPGHYEIRTTLEKKTFNKTAD